MKVLSWNIFNGLGSPRSLSEHLVKYSNVFGVVSTVDQSIVPQIARVIAEMSPDIVGLEELDVGSYKNKKYDQLATVQGVLSSFFSQERSSRCNDGNALMTRIPIIDIKEFTLPYQFEKRTCIAAKLLYKKRPILAVVTHLAAHSFNTKLRDKQLQLIAKYVTKESLPTIVLGDFNCTPSSKEFVSFLNATRTRALINEPTFPSYARRWCLDNILVTKEFKVKESSIHHVLLSDHVPVSATIEL